MQQLQAAEAGEEGEESDDDYDDSYLWEGLEHLEDGSEIPDEVLGLTSSREHSQAILDAAHEEQVCLVLLVMWKDVF